MGQGERGSAEGRLRHPKRFVENGEGGREVATGISSGVSGDCVSRCGGGGLKVG